jgi:hypothetical protein
LTWLPDSWSRWFEKNVAFRGMSVSQYHDTKMNLMFRIWVAECMSNNHTEMFRLKEFTLAVTHDSFEFTLAWLWCWYFKTKPNWAPLS